MPKCRDAKLLQVVVRLARKNSFVNLVFAERSLILSKAKPSLRGCLGPALESARQVSFSCRIVIETHERVLADRLFPQDGIIGRWLPGRRNARAV
jgi:hypothetical protein